MKKTEIFGNCWEKLSKSIGTGGAGSTFVCYRVGDENKTPYVIKILNHDRTDKINRFDNEIKILQKIEHPRIIKCIDSYHNHLLHDDKKKWYIMKKGTPLISMLESSLETVDSKKYYSNNTLRMILLNSVYLLKALKYLHKKGIIHRDIKPENLICIGKKVLFIDFGIAKIKESKSNITEEYDKKGIGAKFYMAPEMRRNPLEADLEKADIYSFSKTLWACLTGEYKSFDGEYNRKTMNVLNYSCCEVLKEKLQSHLEILHNFFEKNTASVPDKRMTIDESIDALNDLLFCSFDRLHVGNNSMAHKAESEKSYLLNLFLQNLKMEMIDSISISMNHIPLNLVEYMNLSNQVRWHWNRVEKNRLRNVYVSRFNLQNNGNNENIKKVNVKIEHSKIKVIVYTDMHRYIFEDTV